MYHALRAIGNAGRPRNVRDLIVDCIKNAAHVNVSVAAVHALRRMPKDDHVKEVLREIVSDKNVDTERRMEAFLMLMEDPIDEEIILAVDMVHDEQEAGQLRSFFHSFLTNAVKNKNPMRKRYYFTHFIVVLILLCNIEHHGSEGQCFLILKVDETM